MIGFALTQLAAISLGLALCHASKPPATRRATRIAFAFAAGHGFLALLTLGLGVTGIPVWIAPIATLPATAIYAARHRGLGISFPGMRALNPGRDPVAWAAVLLLLGFGAVALLQALAPPAAKDEVMYQLAVAKWYRLEQAVVFVPNNWPFHFPQLVNLSFLQAMTWTTEANAVWLQYTAPFWVFLVGVFWLGETAQRRDVWMLVWGMLGVAVILFFELQIAAREGGHVVGVVWGLASGITFALVIVTARGLRDVNAAWVMTLNHLATAIILGPYVAATGLRPRAHVSTAA